MDLLERYYPSSEHFLLGSVQEKHLYEYIYHGFALIKDIDGQEKYVSYSWEAPMILVRKTDEIEEVFRKKDADKNNNSMFIRLMVKLKHIQIHHGDCPTAWALIKEELAKAEHQQTLENYKVTIDYIMGCMFPCYNQ